MTTLTIAELKSLTSKKVKVKYKKTNNNPEQLIATKICIKATLGIAVDYHYFMTIEELNRKEKKLIGEGFTTERI